MLSSTMRRCAFAFRSTSAAVSHRPCAVTARFPAIRSMATRTTADIGIDSIGIKREAPVHFNLDYDEIFQHEVEHNEGIIATKKEDTFCIRTAPFYGRSPKDRYIVESEPSRNHVDWGAINQPMKPEVFDELYERCTDYLSNSAERLYVYDAFVGTSKSQRRKVRFITEFAWQHHFVQNMFVRATPEELETFGEPDFTIINACKITNPDSERHGLNSEVFVGFNIEKKCGIIGGTHYGGEMKKGIFAMMNYWLPMDGHLPMHCSANKGDDGSTALFFGLSGTGKTTLSADSARKLIGDDEHGWDDEGIFNFEGGCYAKTINLSEENEPDIYRAIRRNALLENVLIKDDGTPDFDYIGNTENGRVSYPINHIQNFDPESRGGHPKAIVFLTCDAAGVLPPVSRLTPEQAMYHFLSGYTAKIPGTERGVKEPEPTFSACFGAVFMPLHPFKYAEILKEKMNTHGSQAFLVNTGWSGGPYRVGKRIDIPVTRACINGILDGSINDAEFEKDDVMNLEFPTTLGSVDPSILNPRSTWEDKEAYDAQRLALAKLFQDNFGKFSGDAGKFAAHGPKV